MNPVENVRTIDLEGEIVILDPQRFVFTDATLSQFMQDVSLYYDYYSSKSAKSEELLTKFENEHETLYLTAFLQGKESGFSDKGAEAFAKISPDVKVAYEKVEKYKSTTKQLKEYLKSFDKAHNMAQNRGYMIRKELDKLGLDIKYTTDDINNIVRD